MFFIVLFTLLYPASTHGDIIDAEGRSALVGSVSPEQCIGFTLRECYDTYGAPREVFSMRGETVDKDVVVFYYDQAFYFYWYDNRVWQVRCDERYEGDVFGITIGDRRWDVIEELGQPMKREGVASIYSIDDRGYPLHMALYYEQGKVVDIYIYRADF